MKSRWKKPAALLLSLSLALCALPAAAQETARAQTAYITDADGCWYVQTEEGMRPIGSANPAAPLKNLLTLPASEALEGAAAGGMVRLSWSAQEDVETYQIYRGTAEKQGKLIGQVYADGPDFSQGSGYWFYDMEPESGSSAVYRVIGLGKKEEMLSSQAVSVSIPTENVPARKGVDSRVQSGSYKGGVLTLSPMPVTGIPYNVYVGVSTRSGKVVMGTTADNIVTEYDSKTNVATSTFRKPLMKGKYTATMSINIWNSGINFTNPYTMLKCTFDFEVK